jgi:hypothetical protein
VDDCQSTYLKKLKKETMTPNPKNYQGRVLSSQRMRNKE